jgi:hypothetical protein
MHVCALGEKAEADGEKLFYRGDFMSVHQEDNYMVFGRYDDVAMRNQYFSLADYRTDSYTVRQ